MARTRGNKEEKGRKFFIENEIDSRAQDLGILTLHYLGSMFKDIII
jgi:hypothetical protein